MEMCNITDGKAVTADTPLAAWLLLHNHELLSVYFDGPNQGYFEFRATEGTRELVDSFETTQCYLYYKAYRGILRSLHKAKREYTPR